MNKHLRKNYLDWVNNYLCVAAMAYFKTVNLNKANDRREQERQAQERLAHWARLRTLYPAIEKTAK